MIDNTKHHSNQCLHFFHRPSYDKGCLLTQIIMYAFVSNLSGFITRILMYNLRVILNLT